MKDIFYFTDIHGVRPLYDTIINYCLEQDPECTIIFGGDACDRGTEGYYIMKDLLSHKNIIYLKGNHEDLFVKAARVLKTSFDFSNPEKRKVRTILNACRHFDEKYQEIQDSLYNGGIDTLTDWIMDGADMDFVERIDTLPLTFSYENKDFCHAGSLYNTFKIVSNCEYEGITVDPFREESLLWNRSGLNEEWCKERVVIFGHTPTPYLEDYVNIKIPEECDPQPILYANGQKLDMDTGAVFTNNAYVLNILTMKAQGFNLENDTVKKIDCIQF